MAWKNNESVFETIGIVYRRLNTLDFRYRLPDKRLRLFNLTLQLLYIAFITHKLSPPGL